MTTRLYYEWRMSGHIWRDASLRQTVDLPVYDEIMQTLSYVGKTSETDWL